MKKNYTRGFFVIIILCYLLAGAYMGHGADVKGEKINILQQLVFDPQTSSIVGIGSKAFSIVKEKSIRFWSIKNGMLKEVIKVTKPLNYEASYSFYTATISHDSKIIAVSFLHTPTVGCYSLKNKKWLWTVKWLGDERYSPQELTFTLDDKKLIAVGEKNTVIYDAKTGDILERQTEPLSDYILMSDATTGAVLSPSSRYLVVWQRPSVYGALRRLFMNKSITVWDIKENKLVAQWKNPKQRLYSAVFTPDEKYILFSSGDGFLSDWSISEQKIVREWKVSGRAELNFSPDGRLLATNEGCDVKIYNYLSGEPIHEFITVGRSLCDVPTAFSPDSKYFALEKNGNLCLYDTETWKEKWCATDAVRSGLNKSSS